MVLFDDVIEILRLTKFDGQAGVLTDAANGSGVSTAFVDGDLLRQTLQVDCTRQIAPRPRPVSLGSQKEATVSPALSTARYRYFHWTEPSQINGP